MEKGFKYDTQDMKVSIHTKDESFDITNYVISVNTNKSLSNPIGGFVLSVIPAPLQSPTGSLTRQKILPFTSSNIYQSHWIKKFTPNDLVLISYTTASTGNRIFTMSALLDNIHRVKKIETNAKLIHTIDITGRDAGKILEQNDVSLISNIEIDRELVHGGSTNREALRKLVGLPGFATRSELVAKIVNTSVKNAVEEIMDWYRGFYNKVIWNIEGQRYKMGNMIDSSTRVDAYENELIQGFEIGTAGGNLLALINQIAEKPFYEFFLDSHFHYPGTAYFTVRPTPFSEIKQNTLWGFLNQENSNFHYINEADIIMEDTAKSDSEVKTAFKITPAISGVQPTNLHNIFRTKLNEDLFRRYGLRMLDVTSRHQIIEDKKFLYNMAGSSGFPIADKKRQRTMDWYFPNDKFQSGELIINGNDRIRVGEHIIRLLGEEDQMVYYVESVKQHWRFGQKWTTSLGVTRGLSLTEFYNFFPKVTFRYKGSALTKHNVWDRGTEVLDSTLIV